MNIQELSPARSTRGFCADSGKIVTVVHSVRLPSMESIRSDSQSWGIGQGLRLRIDTLQALGMKDDEISSALAR